MFDKMQLAIRQDGFLQKLAVTDSAEIRNINKSDGHSANGDDSEIEQAAV